MLAKYSSAIYIVAGFRIFLVNLEIFQVVNGECCEYYVSNKNETYIW